MIFAIFSVWAVQFSNYDPAEIDSLWTSKRKAKKRADELGGGYDVVRFPISHL